ncbi:MAG TPA: AP2 domain-containing protein [Methanosarcina sp.]|nr:AP2 domain-containing protein [Methanosarcina sp.]
MLKPELIEVLGYLYPNKQSKQKRKYGLYKCKCGNMFKSQIYNVDNGNTNSCGCYAKYQAIKSNTIHGKSTTDLYKVYRGMLTRCYSEAYKEFHYYGGARVIVCDEWRNDFISFYNWAINNQYKKGLSIDRIDSSGNYEPSNCRWANNVTQSRNRRLLFSSNSTGFRGVTYRKDNDKYRSRITVDNKLISIGNFKTAIEAAKAYDDFVIKNNLEHPLNFNLLQ